jgi:hypothetical protein
MAKKNEKNLYELMQEGKGRKRTSIGHRSVKFGSMNKRKKASYKAYRGQG